MSFTLYHLLLAVIAALALSGCTSPGGAMNWGPFQRRTDTADTLPVAPSAAAAARPAATKAVAAAPAATKPAPAKPAPAESSSWLPSWNPFASSAASAPAKGSGPHATAPAGGTGEANPNLDAYQLPVPSRLAKGRDLERAGQYERAREIYEELIRQYPQAAEPYHRLGIVADKQGRYREAQDLLIQSLRLDPRNANVRIDLGYCFYMQGQLPQAEAETRAALELDPRDERGHNNLGLILGAQDRMAEALEHFRRGGSEADAQFNMAFVFASRSELDAAKECFRRALDINPHHEKAQKALDSFVTYENQPEEIRRAMEASFEAERRGTIPFVEPGTVMKASAEGAADGKSSPAGSVVPATGGARGVTSPGVVSPRQASSAIRSLHRQARDFPSVVPPTAAPAASAEAGYE